MFWGRQEGVEATDQIEGLSLDVNTDSSFIEMVFNPTY